MEVTGTLKAKFDTQKVSDRFQKREFVLSTELSTPYPQHVSFQVTQDKCTMLDQFSEGDELKVQFNLRGREWTSPQGEIKYFNTLEAWKIDRVSGPSGSGGGGQEYSENIPASQDKDDLPF